MEMGVVHQMQAELGTGLGAQVAPVGGRICHASLCEAGRPDGPALSLV